MFSCFFNTPRTEDDELVLRVIRATPLGARSDFGGVVEEVFAFGAFHLVLHLGRVSVYHAGEYLLDSSHPEVRRALLSAIAARNDAAKAAARAALTRELDAAA